MDQTVPALSGSSSSPDRRADEGRQLRSWGSPHTLKVTPNRVIFRSIMPTTRREFLTTAALAGSALAFAAPEPEPWFDRPLRWAQLTLVEDDPGKYDPSFWLDYFKRTHSDAACLSAGGCVAYYPTKIPLALSQQVAGECRCLRRAGDRLPAIEHECDCTHRSSCGPPGCLRCASGLDCSGCRRAETKAPRDARVMDHLRARSLQLRLHDGGD